MNGAALRENTATDRLTRQSNEAEGAVTRRDTGLVWGIKDSFLAYVGRMPDTSVSLAPGSGQLPDGRFYFSPDPDAPAGGFWFRGGFRLRAHGGLLDLSLADPRVEEQDGCHLLTGETWNLGTWERIRFAELDWPNRPEDQGAGQTDKNDAAVRTFTATARLHPDATGLFEDTYPAREPLAPLVIRMPQEGMH